MLDSKTVVVIDEAGMLGTKQLAALTRLVRKARATLILAGDDHQVPPIEAGAPFSHLLKKLPAAELTNNQLSKIRVTSTPSPSFERVTPLKHSKVMPTEAV